MPPRARGYRVACGSYIAEAQGGWVLLAPERIFKADAIAAEILKRCTGELTFGQLVDDLANSYTAPREKISTDVASLLRLGRQEAVGVVIMVAREAFESSSIRQIAQCTRSLWGSSP